MEELEEIFRSKVLAMMKGEDDKIHAEVIEKVIGQHHTGFSVHAESRIARDVRQQL
jgi:hypothetical protein